MALRYSPLAAALGLAFSGAAWAQHASEVAELVTEYLHALESSA